LSRPGEVEVLSIEEINAEAELDDEKVSQADFEAAWAAHVPSVDAIVTGGCADRRRRIPQLIKALASAAIRSVGGRCCRCCYSISAASSHAQRAKSREARSEAGRAGAESSRGEVRCEAGCTDEAPNAEQVSCSSARAREFRGDSNCSGPRADCRVAVAGTHCSADEPCDHDASCRRGTLRLAGFWTRRRREAAQSVGDPRSTKLWNIRTSILPS